MRQSLLPVVIASVFLALASSTARAEGANLTGQRAPELNIQQGLQGVSAGATLSSFSGKVVVLKFFFSSCPYCRASLPEFESTSRRYVGRSDVVFLALAYDNYGTVQSLIRGGGYTFAVGIDPSGVTPSRYGVHTYPTNYVIGADGYVKAYDDISTGTIDRAIGAAPAGRVAPVVSPRDAKVRELGDVPTELSAAKDAAGDNDYGQVLRVVEPHLDASKNSAAVVAAAKRIQEIAIQHYFSRAQKILSKWNIDNAGAWRDVDAFVSDFRGTSKSAALDDWVKTLGARPAR